MNERPTPETDAHIRDNGPTHAGHFIGSHVMPDFARKLERERDEALSHPHALELQSLDRALADALRERDLLIIERDNLQGTRDYCMGILIEAGHDEAAPLEAMVRRSIEYGARMEKERDEAREDKARLDWLGSVNPTLAWIERRKALSKPVQITEHCDSKTIRAAIDAAMLNATMRAQEERNEN